MSILETFTKSETDPSKHKCGDYVAHEYLYGKYWVLALADGVGSRPCDWKASKTTCEQFIAALRESLQHGLSAEAIEQAALKTDTIVSNPPSECKGMMAALSAVVWEHTAYFVSVGDTRVYRIASTGTLTQLSTDDLKAVNIRDRTGKLILTGGSTVTRSGLTNAFGLLNVKVSAKSFPFVMGDTVVLSNLTELIVYKSIATH